jgi:O-antigen ligase
MAVDLLYVLTLAARGPQIAILGSLFVFPFVLPGKRFAVAGLVAVLLLAVIGFSQRERLNARFGNERTMSGLNDRTKVWAHTWELSMQRPWTGYGWGNRVFEKVYYESDPPESVFHFPHCHQYWLSRLFAWGWPGLILSLVAWVGLVGGVYRVLLQRRTWRERSLPAGLLGILAVLHLYGMGDQPQGLVPFFLIWSIPCGLVLISEKGVARRGENG